MCPEGDFPHDGTEPIPRGGEHLDLNISGFEAGKVNFLGEGFTVEAVAGLDVPCKGEPSDAVGATKDGQGAVVGRVVPVLVVQLDLGKIMDLGEGKDEVGIGIDGGIFAAVPVVPAHASCRDHAVTQYGEVTGGKRFVRRNGGVGDLAAVFHQHAFGAHGRGHACGRDGCTARDCGHRYKGGDDLRGDIKSVLGAADLDKVGECAANQGYVGSVEPGNGHRGGIV